MKKWIVAPIGLLVLIFVSTLVYFGTAVSGKERTYRVKRVTMERVARGIGKVESVNEPAQLAFAIPGQLKSVQVKEGQSVKQGVVLAELDTTGLDLEIQLAAAALDEARAHEKQVSRKARPEEIHQLQEKVNRAKLEIEAAEVRLKNLEKPTPPAPAAPWEIQEATRAVNQAVHNYNAALYAQKRLTAGPTEHELAAALKKVDLAIVDYEEAKKLYAVTVGKHERWMKDHEKVKVEKNRERMKRRLELAQAEYDRLKKGPTKEEIKAAEARTLAAKIDHDRASASLARLRKPPTPPRGTDSEIALARNNVARAKSAEREARASLALLKAGPRPEDIAAAKAAVARATRALELARAKRKQAVLTAPFDGTVVARNFEPGSSPAPFAPVISLSDISHLRVRGELDVRFSAELKEGQMVKLDNRALFREPLTGKITKVKDLVGPRSLFSHDPTEIKGGEVAVVLINVSSPEGESQTASHGALRPGLRLDVEISFETHENVLSAPRTFVATEEGKYVVYRAEKMANGKVGKMSPVEVQLGFRDGLNVEILSGLVEGDYLVQPAASQR